MAASGQIQVVVRWAASGSSLTCLQLNPESTVDTLRQSIARYCRRKGHVNFVIQVLLNGKVLEGSQTLAAACINDETPVDVVLRPVADRGHGCKGRVAFIGAPAVGKSSLIAHFTGDPYEDHPTVGIDFSSKIVHVDDHRAVRLQFWDISDHKRSSLLPVYVDNADAVVVVYDITDHTSFGAARDYLTYVRGVLDDCKPVWLIGNKVDRTEFRKVTEEDGETMAKEFHAFFEEASASTGNNVSPIFYDIADEAQDANARSNRSCDNRPMSSPDAGVLSSPAHEGLLSSHEHEVVGSGETPPHLLKTFCKHATDYVNFALKKMLHSDMLTDLSPKQVATKALCEQ